MWDTRALGKRLKTQSIDAGNSPLIPLYDPDSEIMLLTGRVHIQIFRNFTITFTSTHLFGGFSRKCFFVHCSDKIVFFFCLFDTNFQGDSQVKVFEMKSDAPHFTELLPFTSGHFSLTLPLLIFRSHSTIDNFLPCYFVTVLTPSRLISSLDFKRCTTSWSVYFTKVRM